ncbi:hypothetical protein GCM10010140_38990 [Streptosporangium pseudovulgare]|uniref:Uncharacterized protein n=1 Tax=Streptosporangium pseudovulgare TaxID=35765 RepID=A0ABQ2R2S4_9ACTN|nr:hypothetical protein GCM10010140_38990 [Streptosporangium pseudovulgare]
MTTKIEAARQTSFPTAGEVPPPNEGAPAAPSSTFPALPNPEGRWLTEFRADVQARRGEAARDGEDTPDGDGA